MRNQGPFSINLANVKYSLFPCNTSDAYVPALEFAGESFQINPLDWNIGAVSDEDIEMLALGNQTLVDDVYATAGSIDDLCISGLIGADLTSIENLYVIGDVFIKNVSKISPFAVFHLSVFRGVSRAVLGFTSGSGPLTILSCLWTPSTRRMLIRESLVVHRDVLRRRLWKPCCPVCS